ncbi:MAG: radical SAM protein [Candidatus Omnitrophica bacterium]|nr:radical SAM protein [Candidatus Omnitrophota bacterium]MCB9719850.1 radical SAM protein [Candidatus Omnitrophota bacterium]
MYQSQEKPTRLNYFQKVVSHLTYFDFVYKNPWVVARLIKNYFRIIVLRQQVIRIIDIGVTAACNAKCAHCCSDATVDTRCTTQGAPEMREPLDIEEIEDIIAQSVKMGAVIFNFLGGEPLVYKDIYRAIRCVKKHHAIAGMSTNGFLLSEKVVAQLKEAGLDCIQVDLGGGLNPKEIDEIRGLTGCLDRALNGIRLLKEANIKVIMSTIMTKKNAANGDIWKMVQLAKDLNIKINVNCSSRTGGWAGNEDSELSEKEFAIYKEIIKMPHTRWAGSTNYFAEFCPCGTEKIMITTYGEIQPCGLIPLSYGNFRSEAINDIWTRMQTQKIICDGKKEKACRSAWDKDIIRLNTSMYETDKPKPLRVDDIPQERLKATEKPADSTVNSSQS